MHAIGCRAAAAGETSRRSSGAATRVGPGLGLGPGFALGLVPASGEGEGPPLESGVPPVGLPRSVGEDVPREALEFDSALKAPPIAIPTPITTSARAPATGRRTIIGSRPRRATTPHAPGTGRACQPAPGPPPPG